MVPLTIMAVLAVLADWYMSTRGTTRYGLHERFKWGVNTAGVLGLLGIAALVVSAHYGWITTNFAEWCIFATAAAHGVVAVRNKQRIRDSRR